MVCFRYRIVNTLDEDGGGSGGGGDDDDDDNNNNLTILNMWNNITCSTNSKYRSAATLYTLEIWFASGIEL